MTVLVVGFKESRNDIPKVVYCGPSGSDGLKAAADAKRTGKFRFFGKQINPRWISFTPPEPAASAVASTKEN